MATPAKLVAHWPENPGEFQYSHNDISIIYCCPCGCGTVSTIFIKQFEQYPVWTWDGNRENPTCTPSIQRKDGCKWHGFLTNGIWKQV